MMELLKDLFNWLKKKGFIGGLIFGIILAVVLIGFTINFKYSELFYFIGHKQEFIEGKAETQVLFKNYIKSNKDNLHPFFVNSKENQKVLLPIIVNSNIPQNIVSKVLDISNREIDKFRIVSKVNNYALTEFENNRFNRNTQVLINDLFHSFKLILNNKKEDYIKASELLKKSYQELEESSEEIRLETLRYLTYCYFAVNDNQNAIFWLNVAKKSKDEHSINYSNYISNYFWVDLLDLWISIINNDSECANKAFNSLYQNADPKFVELKLLQHELRLSGKNLKLWRKYIEEIKIVK